MLAAGLAVAAGAAAWWFNDHQAAEAEAQTPPAGQFVEADGVRLHYVEQGTGSPIVLLHGNGVTLQDWQASGVMSRLAAQHRVIAFDRPGFGYSERPRATVWTPQAQAAAIVDALGKLGAERPVVVGHSWGTLVALAMALDHRAAVGGLVLLSGYYFGTARPDVLLFSPPAIPGLGDAMAHTVSPLAGRALLPLMVKQSFAPAPVADSFADFPIAMTLRPSQIRATAADTALMVPAAISISGRYGELDLPIAILAGVGDRIAFIDEHAEELAKAVPGAELRRLEGLGHMIQYSDPDAVADAIRGIAARVG